MPPINETDLAAASIDDDMRPILSDFLQRIEALEAAADPAVANAQTVAMSAILDAVNGASTPEEKIEVWDRIVQSLSPDPR